MKGLSRPSRAGAARRALGYSLAIVLAGQSLFAPLALAVGASPPSAQTPAPSKPVAVAATPSNLVMDGMSGAAQGLLLRVGTAPKLSHLEFSGGHLLESRREGPVLVLKFSGSQAPDLSRLHVNPPPFVKDASASVVQGGVEVRILLDDGVDARVGEADLAYFVNLAPSGLADAGSGDQTPGSERADPAPTSGSVHMRAKIDGRTLSLSFPWQAPLGAAIFQRGDRVLVVFDARAVIDVKELATLRNAPVIDGQTLLGKDFSAVSLHVAPGVGVEASSEGAVWTLRFNPQVIATPEPISLERDEDAAGLQARLAGATGVFWVIDPEVGDRLAVVTALGPRKAVHDGHSFIGGTILPTVHGMVIQANSDSLKVAASTDLVRIGSDKGLMLSPAAPNVRFGAATLSDPQPAPEPGVILFKDWSKTGPDGFIGRQQALFNAATVEAGEKRPGHVQARMAYARFLVGSGLFYEAIGFMNLLARSDQLVLSSPEFRGLRGAAKAMAGRYKDAQGEFSTPLLAEERSIALWRGYVAQKLGDVGGARQQFAAGRGAISQFDGLWKSRLSRAEAEADLSVNDLIGAQSALQTASSASAADADEDQAVKLDQGKMLEALGKPNEALALYDQVANTRYGAVAAPAKLRALQIRLSSGKINRDKAGDILDGLRFIWRGDATELEVARLLGRLDLDQGRYRDALEVLRASSKRLPDHPAAIAIQNDLSQAFRALFLEGRADGMQPIQALGLFYDFKELTPIGADGDAMVRRLAHRLVDVDLLPQAADLLKYQVENRLDGVARAEVASDLASVYLIDRKPEQALDSLNKSRTTLLPIWLNLQRRQLEARALVDLGRLDHAMEVLGDDKSADADEIRAEGLWKAHDWSRAGPLYEALLGERWKGQGALSPQDEARLTKAGVAFSLLQDDAALTRLRTRFGKLADQSPAKDAMRLALAGVTPGEASFEAYGRALAEVDAFSGWVASLKKRVLERTSVRSAQLPQAPAKSG